MIWCVEDDESIREIIVYTLRSVGFLVEGFADGEALFQALKHSLPKLVLLDIMLPGMDGNDILRRLKTMPTTHDLPVIMTTAKGLEYDKVKSLDIGADDYLVKPFGMMEMVSRIKAVLRRSERAEDTSVLKLSGLVLNQKEHTVTADGERILLSLKEFELLRIFLQHPGMVFSRDQLLTDIWGIDYDGETRTVDVHIRTLRQKLNNYGDIIQTVRGVGYRLEDYK